MTNAIQSEADALKEILEWSKARPVWQRDALKRLTKKDTLSEQDIDELTALCLDDSLQSAALEEADLSSPASGLPPVQLKSVGNVQNVNALAENQRLNFLDKGVTIIYGDNGAGKSGYVRILKQACRARGRHAPILTNIYGTTSGPQTAEIGFLSGGQTQSAQWLDGTPDTDLLSAVSVFDTATANVHVDATNDVAYTPLPMKLLERLVQACRAVKGRLDAKVTEIEAQTPHVLSEPSCAPDTAVGKLIAGLNKDTTEDDISRLSVLSDEEAKRHAQLAADLSQDPAALIRRLEGYVRRLARLSAEIAALESAASAETLDQLNALDEDFRRKKEAARIAASSHFDSDVLPGTGGEVWRLLWDAARAYSTQEAYPEKTFPVGAEGSRCVLCQQTLTPEASDRLERFEAFVKDRTQRDEDAARDAVSDFIANLSEGLPSARRVREEVLFLTEDLGESELSQALRRFALTAKWVLREILRKRTRTMPGDLASPPEALEQAAVSINQRIDTLRADEDSPERQALQQEYQELSDRKWLAGVKDDAIAEIGRKKQLYELKQAIRDTRQNEITTKSTELAEALVTDRLRGRFAQEVDHLGIAGLAVELKKERSQHGVPQFRVSLIHKPDAKAGSILSEGEHRCVALAGFMAELSTTDNHSGIIFDDPVSSLDHLHREAIAKRLAREGRDRQVIVFTHDLPFLFLLERACSEPDDGMPQTPVAIRHIAKRGDRPGHCENQAPMKAQSAAKRVETIGRHLANTRGQYDQDPEMTWLFTAKGILGQIRDTWESAVETAVAPVIKTFSHKVNTKGFAKLSVITEADAETMRAAYGRCSELLHHAGDAMNPSIPTPDQIEDELKALTDWLEDIARRQRAVS